MNSINFNALGIEISNELYQLSKNIGISSVIHGDIFEFLVKQESKSIKLIILNDILEHFAVEEAINLLKLSYSKLSDDGFIIGHVPCATGIFSNRVRYGDLTHKLAFTTQSLEQLRKFCNYNSLIVFEDKPLGNSIKGVLRRFIWNIICLRYRFIYFIETGEKKVILSQNLTFKLSKN